MQTKTALKRVLGSMTKTRAKVQQFPVAASYGDNVRQGDIYITLLKSIPKNAVEELEPSSQVAVGTTQGSRHCLQHMDGVTIFRLRDANVLQGPIVVLSAPNTLVHPEHGWWKLDAGIYSINYQRSHAEELRRVND